jgi:hypothetical protein
MSRVTIALIEAAIPILAGGLLLWRRVALASFRRPGVADELDPQRASRRLARTRGLGVVLMAFGLWTGMRAFAPGESLRSSLADLASAIQAKLPVRVDDGTRFDQVLTADHELVFVYTLVKLQKGSIDAAELRRTAEGRLKERGCKDPQLRGLLAKGALISARFRDRDAAEVAEVAVPPSACGFEDPEAVVNRMLMMKTFRMIEDGSLPVPRSR